MNFFKKLFGMNTEFNNNFSVKFDSPEVWTTKFFLMVITETTSEVPSMDDIKEIVTNTFPNFPPNELPSVYSSIISMQKNSSNLKQEWDKIWEIFSSQHNFFKLSESFAVCRKLASIAFNLKMADNMEEIAENLIYRISQSEKYFKISKSDFVEILEEEKENTGYNDFLNNNDTNDYLLDNIENKKVFDNKEEKNQKNKSSNIETPHYLTKALVEYELTISNCKLHFKNYVQKLEELIKKARIPEEDKEFIQKNINHGLHKNFDKIDLDGLLRITVKYVFALDMNFKASFKATESEFLSHLKKYTLSKEKYLKISSKVNEQKNN